MSARKICTEGFSFQVELIVRMYPFPFSEKLGKE